MLGDCDHYASPYMRGVAQAMKLLGHQHAEVSIRSPARTIEQRLRLWKPDAHLDAHAAVAAAGIAAGRRSSPSSRGAAKRGRAHRDPRRRRPRGHALPASTSAAGATWRSSTTPTTAAPGAPDAALALLRAVQDRSPRRARRFVWLFFAGTLGGGIYAARSALVEAIRARGIDVRTPPGDNTIGRTAEIAASADAVLGFGRPEIPGWVRHPRVSVFRRRRDPPA
jgi:hypothetical protein